MTSIWHYSVPTSNFIIIIIIQKQTKHELTNLTHHRFRTFNCTIISMHGYSCRERRIKIEMFDNAARMALSTNNYWSTGNSDDETPFSTKAPSSILLKDWVFIRLLLMESHPNTWYYLYHASRSKYKINNHFIEYNKNKRLSWVSKRYWSHQVVNYRINVNWSRVWWKLFYVYFIYTHKIIVIF